MHRLRVLFVGSGRYESVRRFAESTRIEIPVLSGGEGVIAAQYGVRVTPFGFLLDEEGIILQKGLVNGRAHLDWLIGAEVAEPDSGIDGREGRQATVQSATLTTGRSIDHG